jgi:hypothetical protein
MPAKTVTVMDPYTNSEVDITGWDLDFLAEVAGQVWADHRYGNDRELTQDEIDALDLCVETTGIPGQQGIWTTQSMIVAVAADRLATLIHAATQERDLSEFWSATQRGEEPSARAKFAYQAYVAEKAADGM